MTPRHRPSDDQARIVIEVLRRKWKKDVNLALRRAAAAREALEQQKEELLYESLNVNSLLEQFLGTNEFVSGPRSIDPDADSGGHDAQDNLKALLRLSQKLRSVATELPKIPDRPSGTKKTPEDPA
jgi:hypothetical protein